MKRLVIGLVCCIPGHVFAAELRDLSNHEVCVLFAQTLITGAPSYAGTQPELESELRSRSEICSPYQPYFEAAQLRVQNLAAQAQMQAKADAETEAFAAQNEAFLKERRRARVSSMIDAFLLMQGQQQRSYIPPPPLPEPPKTIRCNTFGNQTTCRETGW